MNLLKRIRESSWWKDAVFSKNISQIIWEFAKWVWDKLWFFFPFLIALFQKIPFVELLTHQIEFYWVFVAAFIPPLIKWIFALAFKKPSKKDQIINEIQNIKEIKDKSGKFLYKFNAHVAKDWRVYIEYLNIYCTNHAAHDFPIKMTLGYGAYFCSQCSSSYPCADKQFDALENGLESILEDKLIELRRKHNIWLIFHVP